jgi:two-component system chemotaxis response regulator CheY
MQTKSGSLRLDDEIDMSSEERRQCSVLIIDDNSGDRVSIRQALSALGFINYTDASDHAAGLTKIQERQVTHIIFSAPKTNMTSNEFLNRALEMDPKIVSVATSYNPTVDDVFSLLMIGARGYLVKPFTSDTVNECLNWATNGQPLNEAILFAKDRNEALASLVLSSLDKLALTMRQARQFDTAKRELSMVYNQWKRAVDMAYTFGKGGMARMPTEFAELAIDRAQGPASSLGRFRDRLNRRKAQIEDTAKKRVAGKNSNVVTPTEIASK